jgi:hypothetical protein
MTDDTEINVEQLRAELDQIKDAMGIQERYSGATSMWLLFGFAVPLASALSQYVFTQRLEGWYHALIWAGVLGGAYAVWYATAEEARDIDFQSDGKPNLFVQFGLVYAAIFPIQAITAAFLPELSYVDEALFVQSLIVVLIGLAYGLLGSSLAAYYVRFRDRVVFYVGTAWMMGLGVAIPYVEFLQTWPHASFGGLYFVYAIGTYVVLTRT